MLHNRLNAKEKLMIASMLFGMFFGAGNLIFPIHMGQLAGRDLLPALIGLIIGLIRHRAAPGSESPAQSTLNGEE